MSHLESHRAAAMIVRELREPVVAAGTRHVRTPEGAAKYGQPIGSVIRKDLRATAKRMKARVAKASSEVKSLTAYPDVERTPDGRVILTADQMHEFRPEKGPHSIEAHIEKVTMPDGTEVWALSKEREKLHDELVRKAVEGVKPRPGAKQTYTFTGGGMAAGKSTATKTIEGYPKIRELKDAGTKPPGEVVLVDGDAIKLSLPEWGQPDMAHAATFAHEESSLISKRTAEAALRQGVSVIIDGTGNNSVKSMTGKITKAKAKGYSVEGIYVTVPTEVAMIRSIERSIEIDRGVPRGLLMKVHRDVSSITEAIQDDFDRFDLFDTDIPYGDPPIPIVVDGKIVDKARYDVYLAKEDQTDAEILQKALTLAESYKYRPLKNARTGKVWSAEEVKAEVIKQLSRPHRGGTQFD